MMRKLQICTPIQKAMLITPWIQIGFEFDLFPDAHEVRRPGGLVARAGAFVGERTGCAVLKLHGGAEPVGTGPIQRPTYEAAGSVKKCASVTSRASLLFWALAHRATGSAAPITAASEMRRK